MTWVRTSEMYACIFLEPGVTEEQVTQAVVAEGISTGDIYDPVTEKLLATITDIVSGDFDDDGFIVRE